MHQPAEIKIERETQDIMDLAGNRILGFPQEQTLVICVGGKDYDIRDLVWRIMRADREVFDLQNKVEALEEKMRELEERSAPSSVTITQSLDNVHDYNESLDSIFRQAYEPLY
jgi:hypothetical protein